MDFKLHNGSGSLCCKSCGRQDKQLNTNIAISNSSVYSFRKLCENTMRR